MNSNRRGFLKNAFVGSAAALAAMQGGKQAPAQTALGEQPSTPVSELSIPKAAQVSVSSQDLLDHGAHLQNGQRFLLVAYLDSLYGGDNLVDRDAIHWIQRAVEERGNKVEVLWVDEVAKVNEWKFPGDPALILNPLWDRCSTHY